MTRERAEIVVCGAGIAGIAAAYHLAAVRGVRDVVVVDERAPLSLTSDKSTECYRNWWPGPGDAVVSYMNRSIDLLEEIARETGNRINMSRRGYLFATARPESVDALRRAGEEAAALGAGPLRVHAGAASDPEYLAAPAAGFEGLPDGSDLVLDPALLRARFPYLAGNVAAALHARRCGWLSAQQLGMTLLEGARAAGARLLTGRVAAIDAHGGRVHAVEVETSGGRVSIATGRVVLSPGPYLGPVARLLDLELPVVCERHLKVSFKDTLGAVPGEAPMLIWVDPVSLPWSDDERAALAGTPEADELLGELPAGVHGRPEGPPGDHHVLALWTYDMTPVTPTFPLEWEPHLPEIVLRGFSIMVPALARYLERLPRHFVDGGYYCKTPENRPLVGPLPVEGAFVSAAFSGFGIMAACAGGELLAAHATGAPLPAYAPAFHPRRFDDPHYLDAFATCGAAGQL